MVAVKRGNRSLKTPVAMKGKRDAAGQRKQKVRHNPNSNSES
jgi:hypothetical protein